MALSNQKRSRKQEDGLAKTIGGRRVAGSGNGTFVKNDVRNGRVSVEAKTTKNKSYSLKESELLEAEKHALIDSGREFAFIVQMSSGRQWVVVSLEHALERGLLDGSTDES